MTIQNWSIDPSVATIVTDTITTDMVTNRPVSFISKAFVIPHLSAMIAPQAWAYPATTLYSNLALGNGPDNYADLPAYAADMLRAAAAGYPHPQDWHRDAGAAVFVWNEGSNAIDGWRFLARDQFRAERMPYNQPAYRPIPRGDVGGLDWHQIGLLQQAEDREIPIADRDNVGGHLVRYEMRVDTAGRPPTITIVNGGRMPHYAEQALEIGSNASTAPVSA